MENKLYLKDIVTHLIKDSVKRLFDGEKGNKAVNSFEYKISKKGWEHKEGWNQCFDIGTILDTSKNIITCYFDNTGDDKRDLVVCIYKEKDNFVREAEAKKWYGFFIPYSELSSFEITDEMLREAILTWNEKWSNNHIAPFVEEAVSEPQEWLKIESDYENGREDTILGVYTKDEIK